MKKIALFFTLLLIPADILALTVASLAAYYARLHPLATSVRPVIFDLSQGAYLHITVPIIFIWILIFALSGLYTTKRTSIKSECLTIILACSTSMAAVFAILFFSRALFESRFIAVAAWVFAIVFVTLTRLAIRLLQRGLLSLGIGVHRIVVIGDTHGSQALVRGFSKRSRLGFEVVATFPTFSDSVRKRLETMHAKYRLDELWVTDPNLETEERLALLHFAESHQMTFKYSADLFDAAVGRSLTHMYAGIPIIEVRKTPLDGWGKIYKRLFDLVGSFLLIVVTSPIMLAAAIAIKLDSKGPIFFRHLDQGKKTNRIGQFGAPFHYFKFRTMVPGTHFDRYDKLAHLDTRKGPMVKLKNDPRITRVGHLLRRYSIDELPELFLVFAGSMSLVGPRPHLPEEVAAYAPEHRKVLSIKPGITGMAQISGREQLDFDEEVRLDTYYIEHWSPFLDLYILLKTPLVVFFRNEAS